jgi:DNA-binding transcriptional MerR regulator
MAKEGYTIEEVCARLGVTARTLHYYEEIGLIGEVPRTEGGHRLYDDAILERFEFVLKLKDLLGISLQEVRMVVDLEARLERIRGSYRKQEAARTDKVKLLDEAAPILEELIERMESRIDKLQAMRDGFTRRLERIKSLKEQPEQ